MNFEEIKGSIMNLDTGDKRRLILEVVPEVWGNVCDDPSCALKLKELVDSDIVRPYDEMHMGGI